MARVPPSLTPALLELSATDGVYTELQGTLSQICHDLGGKGGLDQALHLKCQTANALHVVRLQAKYGLRCLTSDQEAVHKIILRKIPFVAGISWYVYFAV